MKRERGVNVVVKLIFGIALVAILILGMAGASNVTSHAQSFSDSMTLEVNNGY